MKRLAVAFVAFALAGCAAIPNTGPVVQGQRVDVVRNDGFVRVIARPPIPGMAPDALVRAFLTASASVADGDNTALQYLTADAAVSWDRQRSTVVYDAAALTLTVVRDDLVRISAPQIGVIDADYRYTAADAGATVSEELQLQQVDGEWRISTVPQALYLSESDVIRSFRPYPLFFLNPTMERLVPEFVLLPIGSGNRATQLLRLLLAGPSAAFRNAVTSALPTRFNAARSRVAVEGVTASVEIGNARIPTSTAMREAMLAQLTWTMWQLSDVVLVTVIIDGQLVQLGDRTLFSSEDFAAYDAEDVPEVPGLTYIAAEQVVTATGDKRVVSRLDAPISAGSVSRDGSVIAAVTADRRLLFVVRDASGPRPVAAGRDLAKPQLLPDGRLWFVDREAQGGLRMWDASEGVRRVIVGLPPAARILDFSIAPDHRRIAIVVNDGATTTLRVGMIEYTDESARVVGLNRIERRLTAITTVAWEGLRSLVVLGSAGAVGVQPIRVNLPLGGMTLLGGPANAVSIAASAGEPIVVGDQAGQLWEFRENRWNAGALGTSPIYVS